MDNNEIYFEIIPLGNVVKAIAIDAKTGIEAVVMGPNGTPVSVLKNNALKKLEYLKNKKKNESD
ncbi:MAG: hypothetical protein BWY78_00257 [Alphaproteobacteria bacterium ADurb.Bin438]|nr:MAG: hypothetical protein BWY78_00257 [Alphaproteobacteria bacterium ADurb.Bin438]